MALTRMRPMNSARSGEGGGMTTLVGDSMEGHPSHVFASLRGRPTEISNVGWVDFGV